MSTIDNVEIIKQILANDGQYPGDPQCYSVWVYINNWGGRTYKVCNKKANEIAFMMSPNVGIPELLWNMYDGLTQLGKDILSK